MSVVSKKLGLAGLIMLNASAPGAFAFSGCAALNQSAAIAIAPDTGSVSKTHSGLIDWMIEQATLVEACRIEAVEIVAFAEPSVNESDPHAWANDVQAEIIDEGIDPQLIRLAVRKDDLAILDDISVEMRNRVEVTIRLTGDAVLSESTVCCGKADPQP